MEQQILVLAEEVGEVARAVVKRAQGIRGTREEWTGRLRAEVADVLITCQAIAATEGFDLPAAVAEKWATIQHRDPSAAREPHQPTQPAAPARAVSPGQRASWADEVGDAVRELFDGRTATEIIGSV